MPIVLLLIQAIIFGFFCSYIAKEKNRDGMSWFWFGFFFSILAIFALIAIPKKDKDESSSDNSSGGNARGIRFIDQNLFTGDRSIATVTYQLFLIKRFNIEKNATLEKYVIGTDIFDTLDDSLREADKRYGQKLTQIQEIQKATGWKMDNEMLADVIVNKNVSRVKELARKGIDVHAPNSKNVTLMDMALSSNSKDIIEIIKSIEAAT